MGLHEETLIQGEEVGDETPSESCSEEDAGRAGAARRTGCRVRGRGTAARGTNRFVIIPALLFLLRKDRLNSGARWEKCSLGGSETFREWLV